ncbi:MAG: PAS domain-containing protein [Deltaproteobacteria bacterium]|nr:PAS domain-containing protein [Deltaproteobacteria bacterium]
MLDKSGYERGIARLIKLRWIAAAAALGSLALGAALHIPFPAWPAVLVAVLIPLSNVGHRALARRAFSPRFLLLSQFCADLILLTAFLGILGGIDGPCIPLYIFHVHLAALLLRRREAIAITGVAVGFMGSMAILQIFDAPFPRDDVHFYSTLLGLPLPLSSMKAFVVGQVGMLAVAATVSLLLTSPLAEEARKRGIKLSVAEEYARSQAVALESLLDNVGAMMTVLDSDHRLTWLNRVARERFPLLKIGEIRRCFDPAEPMGGAEPPRCPSCYVLETGESWRGDYSMAVPNGHPRVFRVYATPLFNGDPKLRVVELILDVTEERESEKNLLEARKTAAIAQLAGGVAHELNTPLASLAAGLRSLRRGFDGLAPKEHGDWQRLVALIGDLATQTTRCQGVTESLLGYARQIRSHVEPAELHGIVRGALEDLGARRDLAGIEVTHEAPLPGTPPVSCDPDQLRMVLVNVMSNAVDSVREARRQKGRVRVDVAHSKDSVEIHVKDNGMGIPPAVMERMFDPFFTTKPVGEGSGLGLAVGRGMLVEMGASISVESKPGQGADVILHLRAARATRPGVTKPLEIERTKEELPHG